MLTRLPWALVNSLLWLAAGTAGIVAAISPDAGVRVVAVMAAMAVSVGWAAHTLADHYAEVTGENEMLQGQRHVVFGASEEADHALMRRVPEATARMRRRLAAQRRRRGRYVVAFDPATDDTAATAVYDTVTWEDWAHALSDR